MEPLSTDAAPTHGRLRHIDALRGIAALLVLWRHVADAFCECTAPILTFPRKRGKESPC